MCCPVFRLIVFVASLIHYSSICLSAPFLSSGGEDLRCVVSLTLGVTLASCFTFSATMWSLPRWSLSSSSASSRSPTQSFTNLPVAASFYFAVWVRHPWMGQMESAVREKVEGHPVDMCLCALTRWSITPLMYPASFVFKIPSTAYGSSPAWTSHRHQWQWPRLCWSSSPTMWVLWKEMLGWPYLEPGDMFIMIVFCLPVALSHGPVWTLQSVFPVCIASLASPFPYVSPINAVSFGKSFYTPFCPSVAFSSIRSCHSCFPL